METATKTAFEEQAAFEEQGEFGDSPNSKEAQAAEEKAIECYAEFKAADADRRSVGLAFGHAMIGLREKARHGDWMAYLEQLGISYDDARYWINEAGGKEEKNRRGGAKSAGGPPCEEGAGEEPEDSSDGWAAIASRLQELKDEAWKLKQSQPVGAGRLEGPLSSLAELLGYELKKKGEGA